MTGSLVDPRCHRESYRDRPGTSQHSGMPTAPHTEVSRSAESRHHQASGMHSPTAASSAPAWCRRTELFGPIRRRSQPAPTLVGHVLLFGVAERSDLVAPNVYCRAGGRVCREKKEKPCRDWCDTPCAATRSENRTLAHQNPTQEAGQAEFKPNALLPREDSNLQPFG